MGSKPADSNVPSGLMFFKQREPSVWSQAQNAEPPEGGRNQGP